MKLEEDSTSRERERSGTVSGWLTTSKQISSLSEVERSCHVVGRDPPAGVLGACGPGLGPVFCFFRSPAQQKLVVPFVSLAFVLLRYLEFEFHLRKRKKKKKNWLWSAKVR